MSRKAHNKQDRQPLIDWINDMLSDPEKLFSIPLSYSPSSKYGIGVNKSWLAKQTGVHRKLANTEPRIFALLESIIEAMIDNEIVIKGESAEANDVRRKLLVWYRKLTYEEKLEVPMHMGKVNIKLGLRHISSYRINANTKAVSSAFNSISKELRLIRPKDRKLYARKKERRNNKEKKGIALTVQNGYQDRYKPKNVRQRSEDYKKPIYKWLKRVTRKKDLLWKIEICTNRSKITGELKYCVQQRWISKALGLTVSTYRVHQDLINTIIPVMIDHKIIILGQSAYNINSRRKLYLWFNSLSSSQKMEIPTRNNRISGMYLYEQIGLSTAISSLVRKELQFLNEQLIKIGVLESQDTFICHADRVKLRNKSFISDRNQRTKAWDHLSKITLDKVDALICPTSEIPFIQIKQLFANCLIDASAYSSRRNAIDAYARYVEFVSATQGNVPIWLSDHLCDFSLTEFQKYLHSLIIQEKVSPSYANTLLSSVRKAFRVAKDIEGLRIPIILHEEGFKVARITDAYKPFSDEERLIIDAQIKEDLEDRRKYLARYEKKGIGSNPFDTNNKLNKRGVGSEENARWVFENKLNCKVIHYSKKAVPGSLERSFIKLLITLSGEGEYHELYAKWGIASKIDVDFLMPYFLRLIQVTGLNADSVCKLEIDDYVDKHPATGRACLRYWKERSNGGKEYHLDIFKAKLGWLTTKQSLEIKSIFEEVLILTERIRSSASESIKHRLFIFEKINDVVRQFTIGRLFKPVKRYKERVGIEQFNIARFRPTFVSELIEMGISLREIQLLLGHASMQTTMSYLDKLDFNKRARAKIKEKLEQIHKNTFLNNTLNSGQDEENADNNKKVFFKTPLASCRNIFDPPDFIKNLPTYVHGRPCATYNKCLTCDNVIITSSHLPELFAMQRDYSELAKNSRLGDTPYGEVIEENILLLNELLNPDVSDFSEKELEIGKRLARHIETSILVDGTIA